MKIGSDSLDEEVKHCLWRVKDAFLTSLLWQRGADLWQASNRIAVSFWIPLVFYIIRIHFYGAEGFGLGKNTQDTNPGERQEGVAWPSG